MTSNDMLFRRNASNICDLTGRECSRVGCTQCNIPILLVFLLDKSLMTKYLK